MTDTIDRATTDDAKAKARRMWALGDYGAVARGVIPHLGEHVVDATGVGSGHRVLDVAAGTGNAAIPAARKGARVVANDLTPELLDAGRAEAEAAGVELSWEQGDAESLPYGDGTFDIVVSCVGAMFAPDHRRTASELLRVARPGGTIGLVSWTPQGFIGRMLAAVKPYLPAPPPGAQPAPLWGVPDHLDDLFGDKVSHQTYELSDVAVSRFSTGEEFRDFFRDLYGPTIVAYRNVADDPERRAGLDRALVELAESALVDGRMQWEYLLYTATKV